MCPFNNRVSRSYVPKMKEQIDLHQPIDQELQAQFLLSIRDGRKYALSELAGRLASRVHPDVASLFSGDRKGEASSANAQPGRNPLVKELVSVLRRKKLVAVRNDKNGEEEIQVTPLGDQHFETDPEFESLLPRAPDEVAALEASLLKEGCRDALVVWKERKLLVDGYTRYRFLSLIGRSYQIVEMSFPDRNAVIAWIVETHYGRRNLSNEHKSYWRGKLYLAEKQQHGGAREKASAQSAHLKRTYDKIGQRFGVNGATIRRDAAFAEALDKIADLCGDEVRKCVLNRMARWTKKDVESLATLEHGNIKEIVNVALASGKRPKLPRKDSTKRAGSLSFPKKPGELLERLIKHVGIKGIERLNHVMTLFLRRRRNRANE